MMANNSSSSFDATGTINSERVTNNGNTDAEEEHKRFEIFTLERTRLSRWMYHALRYVICRPGMSIDSSGWIPVEVLVEWSRSEGICSSGGAQLTATDILEIVTTDDQGRFALEWHPRKTTPWHVRATSLRKCNDSSFPMWIPQFSGGHASCLSFPIRPPPPPPPTPPPPPPSLTPPPPPYPPNENNRSIFGSEKTYVNTWENQEYSSEAGIANGGNDGSSYYWQSPPVNIDKQWSYDDAWWGTGYGEWWSRSCPNETTTRECDAPKKIWHNIQLTDNFDDEEHWDIDSLV
jgi:hypothetical protein